MLIDIHLCRHKGFLASMVRFFTRSKWDHITIMDVDRKQWIDFNYGYDGYKLTFIDPGEQDAGMPWELSSFVCTCVTPMANITPFEDKPYSIWFNLNWLTWKLFGMAFVSKGDNCVSFVAKALGYTHQGVWCMSPEELARYMTLGVNKLCDRGKD